MVLKFEELLQLVNKYRKTSKQELHKFLENFENLSVGGGEIQIEFELDDIFDHDLDCMKCNDLDSVIGRYPFLNTDEIKEEDYGILNAFIEALSDRYGYKVDIDDHDIWLKLNDVQELYETFGDVEPFDQEIDRIFGIYKEAYLSLISP